MDSVQDLESYVVVPKIAATSVGKLIPTTHPLDIREDTPLEDILKARIDELVIGFGVTSHSSQLSFAISKDSPCSNSTLSTDLSKGHLVPVIQRWFMDLPLEIRATFPLPEPDFLALGASPYTIYPPLLLLSTNARKVERWQLLLRRSSDLHLGDLYDRICKQLKVTHVALNGPIPLVCPSSDFQNILRSPMSLIPLHGDFGPVGAQFSQAYEAALWVSTRQYGVVQTWAPLHTMFSRGNISEKARILTDMPGLTAGHQDRNSTECSAVDLYAGIGYFAFYYAKVGVKKVLCWEINPWSVEALGRGATLNGWQAVRASESDFTGEKADIGDEEFLVFEEDNQNASRRIEKIRTQLPPIRHVNCGFLPSSERSWKTAVEVLDPLQGGWIHAHENIAMTEIDSRKAHIVQIFDNLVNLGPQKPQRNVQCQHLERVKSYAPGIMHCVLDIQINPLPDTMPMKSWPQPSS